MSEISVAARALAGTLFRRYSEEGCAHAAQGVIDEAVRRAREERAKELSDKAVEILLRAERERDQSGTGELEETPRPELAPAPSSPPDEGRPLTDPLQAPEWVWVVTNDAGDPQWVWVVTNDAGDPRAVHGAQEDADRQADVHRHSNYRVVEYVRGDLHATAIRERDEARAAFYFKGL